MNQAESITVGIVLWSLLLVVSFPPEWAEKLYRGPLGRVWDGLVRAMVRAWDALVHLIARTKR